MAWDAMLWSNGPKELTSSVSLVHRPIACAITIPSLLDFIKTIGGGVRMVIAHCL